MRLRPWHVLVCVLTLAGVCIGFASAAGERGKDILLGVGVNLLSSVVFFVMLEAYWQRMKRANGKEVGGFDYLKFARNVSQSRQVRVLGTFIYPLTDHPAHAAERLALVAALREALARPSVAGVQLLFLNPTCSSARARAAERKDDDVLGRMAESLAALRGLSALVVGPARGRLEIRFFSRTPPFALFQTDNFGSISYYYRDRPISEVTRYEFFMDSPLGEFAEKTFDDLWRDQKTIPLDEYIRDNPDAGGVAAPSPA